MQVASCSSNQPTSLAKLPIDILKGILGWIDAKSIDACMLRQTSSAIKWVLTNCMHWRSDINVNLPFNHPLDRVYRYLPALTHESKVTLKLTSLTCGNLANFHSLGEITKDHALMFRYLVAAIMNGHLDCLKALLDICNTLNLNPYYDELLINSCWFGHCEISKLLISLGANVRADSSLALARAASNGHMHIVTLLAIHGADIHSDRVIDAASTRGHLNVLIFLRALGVKVADKARTLANACSHGHLDVVKFLMSIRTPTNTNDDYPLQQACRYGYLDIVKHLYMHGVHTPQACEYAAVDASKYGYLEILHFLHSMGVNLLTESDLAFRTACKYGHLDVVTFLVSVGADLHGSGELVIHDAVNGGHAHVVEYLYRSGVPMNPSAHILNAAREGHLAMLQFFHSIEPLTSHPELLSSASSWGHLTTVQWLYSVGFDIHYEDDRALRMASNRGSLKIVQFLHSVGANIHADNDAALVNACQFGHLDIVMFLHSVGANIYANGNLHVSDRMQTSGVAKFLKSVMDADEAKK